MSKQLESWSASHFYHFHSFLALTLAFARSRRCPISFEGPVQVEVEGVKMGFSLSLLHDSGTLKHCITPLHTSHEAPIRLPPWTGWGIGNLVVSAIWLWQNVTIIEVRTSIFSPPVEPWRGSGCALWPPLIGQAVEHQWCFCPVCDRCAVASLSSCRGAFEPTRVEYLLYWWSHLLYLIKNITERNKRLDTAVVDAQ